VFYQTYGLTLSSEIAILKIPHQISGKTKIISSEGTNETLNIVQEPFLPQRSAAGRAGVSFGAAGA